MCTEVEKIVKFLNSLMALDHQTMDAMMRSRFVCNKALAESELIMVKESTHENGNEYTVSFRGLIGAIGVQLGDMIVAVSDSDTQKPLGFVAKSDPSNGIQVLSQDKNQTPVMGFRF